MAKQEWSGYGGKEDFLKHEEGKVAGFVEKSGGDVDPYGDELKKDKSAINMDAGKAFNHTFTTQVDAMGTDMAKKLVNQVEQKQDGYHFNTEEKDHNIDPYGTFAGKDKSGQTSKRG